MPYIQSINLTILPGATKAPVAKGATAVEPPKPEYSSREVKHSALLLGDLLRAHSIFLLHHAPSLNALFLQSRRSKFTSLLGRYWDSFLSTWNVLMHGNPANDLFGGIKIAACGELGVGVGEEERGSGEREVLEGFVGRVEGLVDVLVSKFGDGDMSRDSDSNVPKKGAQHRAMPTEPWLGSGADPDAEDGAIFVGTGALSRKSLRNISHWAEDIYRWGPQAYGVVDNHTSTNRKRTSRTKVQSKHSGTRQPKSTPEHSVRSRKEPREASPGPMNTLPPTPIDEQDLEHKPLSDDQKAPNNLDVDVDSVGNKFVQYLKLGYGTHWSVGGTQSKDDYKDIPPLKVPPAIAKASVAQASSADKPDPQPANSVEAIDDSKGHYLIGLLGNIDEEDDDPIASDEDGYNARLHLRTLTVEMEQRGGSQHTENVTSNTDDTSNGETTPVPLKQDYENNAKRLQVVVYVKKPFIFVLLFEPATNSLTLPGLYRSLHHQIGPLIKPLLTSTSFRASKPDIGLNGRHDSVTPIYDLVWDPTLLTVTSTIPNIPDPYTSSSKQRREFVWSRIEALNTHMQIINTRVTTTEGVEKERTCKTSRGWWVVWTRVQEFESHAGLRPSRGTSRRTSTSETRDSIHEAAQPKGKEIFLIRRASDNVGGRKLSSRLVSGSAGGSDEGWVSGPGKLAQGIGIDTKRYIESLLNLHS